MAKQAKMVVDKAFPFPRSTKEFMVPLLNIWEELYTMEFISQDIHFPMLTDSVRMSLIW